jgi:vitamin B12 transporter
MKQILSLTTLLLLAIAAHAQVTISGQVRFKNKPVPAASITLKDTYDGGITDSLGHFAFTTLEKGNYIISISAMGYDVYQQAITIADQPLTLEVHLKEAANELNAVVVTAGSFAAGDKQRGAVLSTLDVITTGGANADITSALKTLPGAQQVGEQEGLFVRGGAGYETKQFIDGMLVANPFNSSVPDIAQRGRFSPFLFKGTVFSTGGYSALYGQALSAAVLLESIDLPERSEVDASVTSVFVGAGTQQITKNKKASYGVNYGYTNLWAYFKLIKQVPDFFIAPRSHTADANFRIKTRSGGMVKYYTTFANTRLGLRRMNIDSLNLKDAFANNNNNWYNNLTWRENLGNGWKMNAGVSYSLNTDAISLQLQDQNNDVVYTPGKAWLNYKNASIHTNQQLTQTKIVLEKKLSSLSALRFGAEYQYNYYRTNYRNPDTAYNTVLKDHLASPFAEASIYITNGFAVNLGGRYEYSSIIGKPNIAPRLALAYKIGRGAAISGAYGIFYQKPENNYLQYSASLGYTKATHYIVNYQKSFDSRLLRLEAYYKKYDALVKTTPYNLYYQNAAYTNGGNGYARGAELYFRDKKTLKYIDYWVSYSYLDTKRDFLNYPEQLMPTFAAKHTFSLVTKTFIMPIKTGFNFTYSYATGRPYYNIQYNGSAGKFNILDQGFTKDFHNLGFSLNYVPKLSKKPTGMYGVLVASVSSLLGYKQVYGYNYSYNGTYKQEINPPAQRFFFVGLFLSWGVDRTQDAINNNL